MPIITMEELCEKVKSLRLAHALLLDELNEYGKKSWLVMTVNVLAHKPQRDEKGRPLILHPMPNGELNLDLQDRLVVQTDGFTRVEFEIFNERRFKVLSNACFYLNHEENQAFAHDKFNVGEEVDAETLRSYFGAYVQLSNLRAKLNQNKQLVLVEFSSEIT
jgi:hypothetical protein